MKEISLVKAKGDAIGFKISENSNCMISDIAEFFSQNDLNIESLNFNAYSESLCVAYVSYIDSGSNTSSKIAISSGKYLYKLDSNLFVDDKCGNDIIVEGDEVFKASEEFKALKICEFHNMVDLFQQIFEWCQMNGYTLDSFNNTEHGYTVQINEQMSEPLSVGDVLFFDEHNNLMTYAFEDLKADGYEVVE